MRPESGPTIACSWQAAHLDFPLIAARAQADFDALARQQLRKALAPFDEHHGLALEDFIETERLGLARLLEPVQVDVVNPAATVLVDEGKRRARDFLGRRRPEPRHNALGERRFA